MIKNFINLFKKEKHTKMVMLWNGREAVHWKLTQDQYNKLIRTTLPFGYSIISELDLS